RHTLCSHIRNTSRPSEVPGRRSGPGGCQNLDMNSSMRPISNATARSLTRERELAGLKNGYRSKRDLAMEHRHDNINRPPDLQSIQPRRTERVDSTTPHFSS